MAFFGATPKAQAAAYIKTYSTASRTVPNSTFTNLVTTAATNVAPYGFTTQAQADAIATKVNALQADVLILKQLIVSLINDSSATLGVGLNAT
jgi:GTPase involved in cell partitioning and DNA repair